MVERCALSGSDLKIKFRTILLTLYISVHLRVILSTGTGTDLVPVVFSAGVPNLPKFPVPILMLYRSVRYRY